MSAALNDPATIAASLASCRLSDASSASLLSRDQGTIDVLMGQYEAALKGLNRAQRQAVETIDGPVLVIAGPGTGKTQLLTTRIARILATTDTLPQNILCLTFTDSAALTMRERLTGMIGQAAYDVTISTYHAFGSDIIRRFPDYFAEDADLRPADDLTIDRTFRAIVAGLPYSNPLKYADNYLADIKTLLSDAKRALLTPEALEQIAHANLTFIKTATPIVRQKLEGVARIDKKLIPVFRRIHEKIAAKLATGDTTASFGSRDSAEAEPVSDERELRLGRSKHARERSLEPKEAVAHAEQRVTTRIQNLRQIFLNELLEAVVQAEESGKTVSLTAWKNAWLAKDENGQFIVDGEKANQKLLAAADIYRRYLQLLKAQSLFDYDDMILRAVHALETNPDLRFTLQEQYQYLLLDEFQDTNSAQLRIVELLTDNPVNEGRPNVLAVGDDDQAIYAFQGANYSHMLQFKELYRDVLVVPLTENYRSHPDVLFAARGVAEQIEERLHHHFPTIEKDVTAANADIASSPAVVERREAQSDVMQFAWVTKRIRELVEQGMPPSEIAVLAPQHKYLEPLVPFLLQENIPVRYDKRENVLEDAAINQLLRMAELALALGRGDHLKANALWAQVLSFGFWELPTSLIWRLSWQATDEDRNWTDELLQDQQLKPIALFFIRLSHIASTEILETMLDYLIGTQPLDLHEPGYANFRSPYYQHYFGSLPTARQGTATFDSGDSTETEPLPLSAGGARKVSRSEFGAGGPVPEQSGKEGDRTRTRSESIALQQSLLLEEPEIVSEEVNAEFWSLLTNLIVLRSRLREYHPESTERLTLTDFIDFVEAHRAADLKILNTSPYATGSDAVQLMTAYKSKGMEFSAVFLLAVNDEAWGGKSKSASSRLSLPPNLQFIRYAGATQDERLRLFYVAITRAKSQLYLVSYLNNYAGKMMTRLKYLNETPTADGRVLSPLLPPDSQMVQPAEDGVPQPTTELAAYWQQRHQTALTSSDMRTLLAERLQQFRLSPSRLNDFVNFVHCGPQQFFMRTILRFPEAPRPEAQFGNAVHEALEWLYSYAKRNEGKLPSEKRLLEVYRQRLILQRPSDENVRVYTERGQDALKAYLARRADHISGTYEVEFTFFNEGVFAGQAHLSGKADKLIIDRQARTIVLVDYKTGKSHSSWKDGRSQNEKIKLHRYRQQLYVYKTLIEKSHTFAGYNVVDAYLEFVEPDEQGRIRELHLDFSSEEQARIERLADAIWQRLMALDLPDTSSYSADLAGIEAFERDLISKLQ